MSRRFWQRVPWGIVLIGKAQVRRARKPPPEAFTQAQIVGVMRQLSESNGIAVIKDRDGTTPLFYLMAPELADHVKTQLDALAARKRIHLLRP